MSSAFNPLRVLHRVQEVLFALPQDLVYALPVLQVNSANPVCLATSVRHVNPVLKIALSVMKVSRALGSVSRHQMWLCLIKDAIVVPMVVARGGVVFVCLDGPLQMMGVPVASVVMATSWHPMGDVQVCSKIFTLSKDCLVLNISIQNVEWVAQHAPV